jgi:hypothetical protein
VRNSLLRVHTAQDIDDQVDKVLRGLGNPPPPLSLDDVRALLKLDRGSLIHKGWSSKRGDQQALYRWQANT